MPVKLPYGDAALEEAKQGDGSLAFGLTAPGRYDVEIPPEKMQAGGKIEFIWKLPLNFLPKTKDMFFTELSSLIPVVSYKLTVVLEDGCGYVSSKDPNQREIASFSRGNGEPKSYFGSCGIAIRPEN